MRLKRLRTSLDPPLQIIVDRLDHVGVKSTDQVVHTPTNRLFGLLRKSSSTVDSTIETSAITNNSVEQVDEHQEVKKKDLERLLEICLEVEMGGRPSSARELLVLPVEGDEETSPPSPTLAFGLESLDDLLQGLFSHPVGWPSGILEIAGTKSSGRTLLATHLAIQTLVRDPRSTCLWVDTEAAFDPDRTREVYRRVVQNRVEPYGIGNDNEDGYGDGKAVDESRGAEEGDRSDPLDRLELATVFDLVGVKQAVEAFRQQYGSSKGTDQTQDAMQGDGQRMRPGRRVGRMIIVVDSIGPILGPCLGGNAHGRAEMQAFLDGLRALVEEIGALCILINSTTPLTGPRQLNPYPSVFSTTTVKPSLGLGFTYTSETTLLLQRTSEVFDSDERERKVGQGRSVVEVLKNRTGPASTWTMFQTDGIGIYDVSP